MLLLCKDFFEDGIPKFPCPSCSIGWLVKIKFEYGNNSETAKSYNEPWFDVENYGVIFSAPHDNASAS
jgi:hypothetical protein